MISHKYKCIFVHIPRVGGSSIEKTIVGKNWWVIEPPTKHILASQARKLYADYWDHYFKFAFVRNPWARAVSMLHFGKMYYGSDDKVLMTKHIDWYRQKFGYPRTIEFDYRFYSRSDVEHDRHMDNCVYRNFLDEDLDFIGRYENIDEDFSKVASRIGLKRYKLRNESVSDRSRNISDYYDDDLADMVFNLYYEDCLEYGYTFSDVL